jgi:hypothetical protein
MIKKGAFKEKDCRRDEVVSFFMESMQSDCETSISKLLWYMAFR